MCVSATLQPAGERALAVEMAALAGGNVRVGLEDSLWDAPGTLAQTNAQQVRRIRSIIEALSLEIATPDEALEIARDASQPIDLLLTDIVMPVMDGAALIRSLHKMGAQVRFLAVSGLVEREKVLVATTAPGAQVEFLAKPFATEKLLNLVREGLLRPVPDAS